MTEYTPKVGKTVTVAGADGEGTVVAFHSNMRKIEVRHGDLYLIVLPSMLTPVPTLPPEPAVGEGVFVDGALWHRGSVAWHHHRHHDAGGKTIAEWSDIAAQAEPAVTRKQVIDEVVEWLSAFDEHSSDIIRAEFGGGVDE